MRLEGKTAIVTGGASGFGAGIAKKFIAEGARVMVADINSAAAADYARELGENAIAQSVDVSNGDSVSAMTDAALAAFGHIDILINNAGVTHLPAALDEISEEDFDRVLSVNVKSVYLTARSIVPHMKTRRRHPQCRLHRRCQPATATQLVQCLQRLDDHGDEIHGRRTCASRYPGQCDQSRCR